MTLNPYIEGIRRAKANLCNDWPEEILPGEVEQLVKEFYEEKLVRIENCINTYEREWGRTYPAYQMTDVIRKLIRYKVGELPCSEDSPQ